MDQRAREFFTEIKTFHFHRLSRGGVRKKAYHQGQRIDRRVAGVPKRVNSFLKTKNEKLRAFGNFVISYIRGFLKSSLRHSLMARNSLEESHRPNFAFRIISTFIFRGRSSGD